MVGGYYSMRHCIKDYGVRKVESHCTTARDCLHELRSRAAELFLSENSPSVKTEQKSIIIACMEKHRNWMRLSQMVVSSTTFYLNSVCL